MDVVLDLCAHRLGCVEAFYLGAPQNFAFDASSVAIYSSSP